LEKYLKRIIFASYQIGANMSNLNLKERRRRLFKEMGLPENISYLALAEKLKDTMTRLSEAQNEKSSLSLEISDKDRLIQDLKARLAKYEGDSNIQLETQSVQPQQLQESQQKVKETPVAQPKVVATSNNSSVPPSKNPIGIKHTRSLRKKSGKKPGGQLGHKGTTYAVPVAESITTEQRWYPIGDESTHKDCYEGICRYVIDIPIGVFVEVTKHIEMCRKDADGNIIKGEFPNGVNSYVSYGPNLQAFITYLNTYMNIPFNKLGELIKAMFGISIDNGTISNILNKMRKLSKKPYDNIREAVAKSKVAGGDESGVNVNGENHWLWTFQSVLATYLVIDKSRGHKVLQKIFEDKELMKMIFVSDRWGAYFTDDVKFKDHQLCLAHLLRNLIYCTEAYPDEPWSIDMIELLRDSIHRRKTEGTSEELYNEKRKRLDELLSQKFINEPQSKAEENSMFKLRESLRKYRDYIFTFLIYPEVQYTNNESEKAVRPMKTKLKVSGCFRTLRGAENYAMFGSIIQTAIKNGQNPLVALQLIAKSAYE